MLKQYFAAKATHPGVLIAMRVGDFYEFYGEDAETAAAALEITLTGREDGTNGRIPMAGVPFHSVEKYLAKLVTKGFKVGLCDQVEDPKTAKGLVRREVTRVLTAGTLLEDSMLADGANSFLTAIFIQNDKAGIATLDSSTGEFFVTEIDGANLISMVAQELARLRPAEVLVPLAAGTEIEAIANIAHSLVSTLDPADLRKATQKLLTTLNTESLQAFGCSDKPSAIVAASMVLGYAEQNGLALTHIDGLTTYSIDGFMVLDPSTRRALELTQNLSDGTKRHTLLSILDATTTSMGSRLLRRWVEQPLLDPAAIIQRQNSVERIANDHLSRDELRNTLKVIGDLERLVGRCATALATPRDLAGLRQTLDAIPKVMLPLKKLATGRLEALALAVSEHRELAQTLRKAISPEPPLTLKDGGVILDGYDFALDNLRELSRTGKDFIAALEAKERERTGISQLKVGYNSVFGYYLEVSKAHTSKVPPEFIRKQTTANAERYITAELKEQESAVLGASEKAYGLESEIFARLRNLVASQSSELLKTARAIAEIDTLTSLAQVAVINNFVKPTISDLDCMEIVGGRHPVVEANNHSFVPNDLHFAPDREGMRLMVLTGPNMSGKSTYLRQAALITLMAQIGCFVPAKKAVIGVCDRVFARIGAKDELAVGQSTFMVEMVESATILNHATDRSLVILDEVGRGTSTYDGMAIAWAILEHLANLGSKTLFATHYHQLNALATNVPGIRNFRVSVQEVGDEIVWTHRVLEGGTDRSYGIHVARMAGVPARVLKRSAEILSELEQGAGAPKLVESGPRMQLSLFEADEPPVVQALKQLDVNQLTPMQALQILDDLKSNLK